MCSPRKKLLVLVIHEITGHLGRRATHQFSSLGAGCRLNFVFYRSCAYCQKTALKNGAGFSPPGFMGRQYYSFRGGLRGEGNLAAGFCGCASNYWDDDLRDSWRIVVKNWKGKNL